MLVLPAVRGVLSKSAGSTASRLQRASLQSQRHFIIKVERGGAVALALTRERAAEAPGAPWAGQGMHSYRLYIDTITGRRSVAVPRVCYSV